MTFCKILLEGILEEPHVRQFHIYKKRILLPASEWASPKRGTHKITQNLSLRFETYKTRNAHRHHNVAGHREIDPLTVFKLDDDKIRGQAEGFLNRNHRPSQKVGADFVQGIR